MKPYNLPPSLKLELAGIVGKKVFKIVQNSLYACFDTGID